jgi:hypothetical protein
MFPLWSRRYKTGMYVPIITVRKMIFNNLMGPGPFMGAKHYYQSCLSKILFSLFVEPFSLPFALKFAKNIKLVLKPVKTFFVVLAHFANLEAKRAQYKK